jgi:hypothetical protein
VSFIIGGTLFAIANGIITDWSLQRRDLSSRYASLNEELTAYLERQGAPWDLRRRVTENLEYRSRRYMVSPRCRMAAGFNGRVINIHRSWSLCPFFLYLLIYVCCPFLSFSVSPAPGRGPGAARASAREHATRGLGRRLRALPRLRARAQGPTASLHRVSKGRPSKQTMPTC